MPKNTQSNIAERLKFVTDSYGVTYTGMAALVDIPYRTFQNYLRGEREPTLTSLEKIHNNARVNINWLITGEGEPFLADYLDKVVVDKVLFTLINDVIDVITDKKKSQLSVYDKGILLTYLKSHSNLGIGDAIDFIIRDAGLRSSLDLSIDDILRNEDVIRRMALLGKRRRKKETENSDA